VTEHTYTNGGSKPLKLDLYRSTHSQGTQPLIVMVHGGSWKAGNKEQLPAINRYLSQQQYTVAAINYQHAPAAHFPAPVQDVFSAIDYLKANAAELRIDATRIVLIGRSAGAQIALAAAYAGREPCIRGVVDFYGPADLVLGYEVPSRRWVLDSRKVLEDYLGGTPTQKPEQYAAGSPLNFVSSTTPPTLLIHGKLDPIVWFKQSELLSARLEEARRPHLFLELPWATHGCDANLSGPSGQLSLYAIDRFLARVFAPPR
jgi:acetyl esterase/lipase